MALGIILLVAVVTMIKPDAFKSEIREKYEKMILSDGKIKTDIDKIHTYLKCCGMEEPEQQSLKKSSKLTVYNLPIKTRQRLSIVDQFFALIQLNEFVADGDEEQDKEIPLDDIKKNTRFMDSCCPKLDVEG